MIVSSHIVSAHARDEQSPASTAVPVTLREESGHHQLLRGGRPYQIRGAGIADPAEIAGFAAHGGNSFRTWRTGSEYLDEAEKYGLTVALCIELGTERQGFDYDDDEAVARQLNFARAEVTRYKDHPALLLWIIGNELNHSFTNPKVFDAINDISRMIHALDGSHPTTTALSGFNAHDVLLAEDRASDLDFLSFQLYASIEQLPQKLEEIAYRQPFMITEWGTTGHWEVAETAWGAPIEMNSSEKARSFLHRHENVIAANPAQILGSYIFLLGQKQERTPTWYGMLLQDGSKTEAMDVMHFIWNGHWPENRAPSVNGMLLDSKTAEQSVVLEAGEQYSARIDAVDTGGTKLTYQWRLMRESAATQQGGDPEVVPEIVEVPMEVLSDGYITLNAPHEPGAYRLFAQVYDNYGLAGHANIPFMVESLQR